MVSMKMMVDTAKSTSETQFILISPQGLGQDAGGKSNWGKFFFFTLVSSPSPHEVMCMPDDLLICLHLLLV